jgi:hypothetical protein
MPDSARSDALPHPFQPRAESRRYRMFREFFLAIRRGLTIGGCGTCESFYLMAKLCLQEGEQWLTEEERRDVESWVEAGTVVDLDTGCDDACPIIRLYSRMSR